MNIDHIRCLDDFQPAAKARLPRQLYSYIANGADDEQSMRFNREAFSRWVFTPRILEGVAQRSQAISLFGQLPLRLPAVPAFAMPSAS